MIACVLDENNVVINRIVVDDLNVFPDLVDGEFGSIGDIWTGTEFIKPPPETTPQ